MSQVLDGGCKSTGSFNRPVFGRVHVLIQLDATDQVTMVYFMSSIQEVRVGYLEVDMIG